MIPWNVDTEATTYHNKVAWLNGLQEERVDRERNFRKFVLLSFFHFAVVEICYLNLFVADVAIKHNDFANDAINIGMSETGPGANRADINLRKSNSPRQKRGLSLKVRVPTSNPLYNC